MRIALLAVVATASIQACAGSGPSGPTPVFSSAPTAVRAPSQEPAPPLATEHKEFVELEVSPGTPQHARTPLTFTIHVFSIVRAESIVWVHWDYDGDGKIDATGTLQTAAASGSASSVHAYSHPGTYHPKAILRTPDGPMPGGEATVIVK